MTMIMQETYGYSMRGVGAFALNRVLRLHPNLWFACLVTVFAILFFGAEAMARFYDLTRLPNNAWDWFQNLTLISFVAKPIEVAPRLSPPT